MATHILVKQFSCSYLTDRNANNTRSRWLLGIPTTIPLQYFQCPTSCVVPGVRLGPLQSLLVIPVAYYGGGTLQLTELISSD